MYAPQLDAFFVVQITRSIRNSANSADEKNNIEMIANNFFTCLI